MLAIYLIVCGVVFLSWMIFILGKKMEPKKQNVVYGAKPVERIWLYVLLTSVPGINLVTMLCFVIFYFKGKYD